MMWAGRWLPAGRAWAAHPPQWISTHANPPGFAAPIEKLQAGERSASLGVLGEAAIRGLVDFHAAIERLRMTNFRCAPALLRASLDRFGSKER